MPELVSVHADIAGVSDVPFEKQQRVIAAVHLIRVISDASHAYSDGSWAHPLTGAKTAVIAMLEQVGAASWCDPLTRELVIGSLGFLVQSSGGESAMASWLLTVDELSHVVDIISKVLPSASPLNLGHCSETLYDLVPALTAALWHGPHQSVVDGGEGAEYEVDSFSKVCVNTLVLNSRLYPTAVLAKAVEPLFAQVRLRSAL